MGKRSRRSDDGRMVSASDLAQMGRCERLVVFEHLHGCRRTAPQQEARARGVAAHMQYGREGLVTIAPADRKDRGFEAAFTFGKARLADVLRRLRVVSSQVSVGGRRLIRLWGRVAPSICRAPRRWAELQAHIRTTRDVMATWLRCRAWWRGGGKCRH
jgi:hypothetical protein